MEKHDFVEGASFLCSGGPQAVADAGKFFCLRGDMAEGFNILEFIYF